MGTPFGAVTREIGGELQLMSLMGHDATTFGNHELQEYDQRILFNREV
jgi:5'-nucleotidase